MVVVHVILSPKGLHNTELEMIYGQEDEGKKFYAWLKPHLKYLDRLIKDLSDEQEGERE